jgi:CRP/FNR family transcriptional regulator, cyclic AMP receptor protein
LEEKGQLLASVPLFAGVTAAGIEELGAIADEVDVRPGTILTHQGYREGYFFIVMSGTVRIERDGRTIAMLGPGEFLGEIALLDAGPRTATAVVETPARLLQMNYEMFHELLGASPEIRGAILEVVGVRLRAIDETAAI